MYPIYIECGKALPLDINSSSCPSLFAALAMQEEIGKPTKSSLTMIHSNYNLDSFGGLICW
jgi:hypothetical protein